MVESNRQLQIIRRLLQKKLNLETSTLYYTPACYASFTETALHLNQDMTGKQPTNVLCPIFHPSILPSFHPSVLPIFHPWAPR